MAAFIKQVVIPCGNADLGFAGSDGQAIIANVVAGRGIGQTVVKNGGNFIKPRLVVAARNDGRLHSLLHRNDQRGKSGVSGLYHIAFPFFVGKRGVKVIGRVDRRGGLVRGNSRGVERRRKVGVFLICQPRLLRYGPVVDGSQDALAVKCIDGCDKSLCGLAQIAFGAFFRVFGISNVAIRTILGHAISSDTFRRIVGIFGNVTGGAVSAIGRDATIGDGRRIRIAAVGVFVRIGVFFVVSRFRITSFIGGAVIGQRRVIVPGVICWHRAACRCGTGRRCGRGFGIYRYSHTARHAQCQQQSQQAVKTWCFLHANYLSLDFLWVTGLVSINLVSTAIPDDFVV